eukprot:14434500-Alexandrium_andersonii.AAC.1
MSVNEPAMQMLVVHAHRACSPALRCLVLHALCCARLRCKALSRAVVITRPSKLAVLKRQTPPQRHDCRQPQT